MLIAVIKFLLLFIQDILKSYINFTVYTGIFYLFFVLIFYWIVLLNNIVI